MPTVRVAHWDEIPNPSAEGLWGQELGWSRSLVEGLIFCPVMTVGSMDSRAVVQPCASLHCLAAAPWDTSCSAGWGGFTLCFVRPLLSKTQQPTTKKDPWNIIKGLRFLSSSLLAKICKCIL